MIETITLALATPIAKAILDKFYEGVGSKLGEKAVEALPQVVKDRVTKLSQLVWDRCLKRQPGSDAVLNAAVQGSKPDQEKITSHIHKELDADPRFCADVKKLADEIHQDIQIDQGDGSEVWNVMGGKAEKNVYQDNQGNVFKDVSHSPINFTTNNNYYGKPPED